MKPDIARPRYIATALLLGFGVTGPALAATSYDSSVALTYSISLLDSTNPQATDKTGLTILGSFQQATDEASFYAEASGDGSYRSESPSAESTPVSDQFQGFFAAHGSANSGTVDTFHTALFGLGFGNDGPYTYQFSVNLEYSLQASAHGEFAYSSILFDYWDEGNLLSGSDYAAAASFTGVPEDQQSVADSATWVFTLAPGETVNLSAQAGIESHVEAAASAPVPVPGAVWLLGSAVAGMGMFGRRKAA